MLFQADSDFLNLGISEDQWQRSTQSEKIPITDLDSIILGTQDAGSSAASYRLPLVLFSYGMCKDQQYIMDLFAYHQKSPLNSNSTVVELCKCPYPSLLLSSTCHFTELEYPEVAYKKGTETHSPLLGMREGERRQCSLVMLCFKMVSYKYF